jgi:hypothetical protein
MRLLACGAAVAASSMLSGCFFVFIPGALIDKVAGRPSYCVSKVSQVGDIFTKDGQQYRITKIVGDSPHYCRDYPQWQLGVEAEPFTAPS